ncbi:MAG: hypothetical protein GXP45_07835 [bacterium]|nr:hypothetical protein [bacterium]
MSPVDLHIVKKIADWPYTSAHQVKKTGYILSSDHTHIRVYCAILD